VYNGARIIGFNRKRNSMQRLNNLFDKLKLYPDLQQEILEAVCEHANEAGHIVLEHTPIRLGLRRIAKDELNKYLSYLEQTHIKKVV
jgi:hypothetical protein